MFAGKPLDAFQFKDQDIFNDAREVCADVVAFVADGKLSFGDRADGTEFKFFEKGSLVDFLEESSTEDVGDFYDGADYTGG